MLVGQSADISIVLPTFNESKNIIRILDEIASNLPRGSHNEVLVVDDNSPDGTAGIVQDNSERYSDKFALRVIKRVGERGLSSAIVRGILDSRGQIVVVMDSDLSHPANLIEKMLDAMNTNDLVIASRYVMGGAITGWPLKRKLISSGATKIAHYLLKLHHVKDPMSGYFAVRRNIVEQINFDALGYKILLEILIKTKNLRIKELPYTFQNRREGSSKLDSKVMTDYLKAVWRLYRYDHQKESRSSVKFASKAARFYTVGASGLLINLVISFLLSHTIAHMWYLSATAVAIALSITSNFFLNKLWTFSDRNFDRKHLLKQYCSFGIISLVGAALQLILLTGFVEYGHMGHTISQIPAILIASVSNFLLNKKVTFKERVWS